MAWRLAASLVRLRQQVNAMAPNRSKTSDGTIGDTAHSARTSAHNPDGRGVVRAWDATHDPVGGFDAHALADHLIAKQDPRLRLVISRGRIGSGPNGIRPGVWRSYSGSNRHDKHIHVEVVGDWAADIALDWLLPSAVKPEPPSPPTPPGEDGYTMPPTVRPGSAGKTVRKVQALLLAHGHRVEVDGDYGPGTGTAVKTHQAAHGLTADGVVGPNTWRSLIEK